MVTGLQVRAENAEGRLRTLRGIAAAVAPRPSYQAWTAGDSAQEVDDTLRITSSLLTMALVGELTPKSQVDELRLRVDTARGHMAVVVRSLPE
jgi:hypothetical protein